MGAMADGPRGADEDRARALTSALAAMGAVAAVVGLVVGAAVLGVFRLTGLSEAEATTEAAPQTLHIPRYRPTERVNEDWPGLGRYTPPPTPELDLPSDEPSASPSPNGITLFVEPEQVAPGQQINFDGVYPEGEGAVLQVQRNEGGAWIDFPVTATVQGGSFRTYILTTRVGVARFRVLDTGSGRASNPVTVTIG